MGSQDLPIRVTPAERDRGDNQDADIVTDTAAPGVLSDPSGDSIDLVGEDSTPRKRRLSKLLPKRRKAQRERDGSSSTTSRRSSLKSTSILLHAASRNQSQISITDNGSSRSSLLTDDVGDYDTNERSNPNSDTLTIDPSHTGFWTLSSPEFSASAVVPADSQHPGDPQNTDDPSRKASVQALSADTISVQSSLAPAVKDRIFGTFGLARRKPAVQVTTDEQENLQLPPSENVVTADAPAKRVEEQVTKPSPGLTKTSTVRRNVPFERPISPIRLSTPPYTQPSTPKTLVTPPTPTDTVYSFSQTAAATFAKPSPASGSRIGGASVGSIKHRRNQSSASASKLSASIPPSLTPTVEETKTPGGTLTQPTSAAGFFSSFLSSAQKAADQLNSSINLSLGPSKGKSTQARQSVGGYETERNSAEAGSSTNSAAIPSKTVDTLGEGNLSLTHLGIPETKDIDTSISMSEIAQQDVRAQAESTSRRGEEDATNRAISSAYEKPLQPAFGPAAGRPLSISSNDRLLLNGDQTPPRPTADVDTVRRTNSVRSKLSGRKSRQRNSSATNSIGAALQSTTTGLANLHANGPGHRLTGFAVASSRRNKDFHQLFRSVPEDDYLIEDYSAALQRDILLHGRLYVSEGHICFSSNILGWVTNLVISFDEVVSVEKKSTAVIFPNAIVIATLHARNTFASFVARDSTYELLIGIWKINHPNLKSSLNGVVLDNAGTGDKTEVAEPDESEHNSEGSSDDEVYDEDDDDAASFTDGALEISVAGSDIGEPTISRKPSGAVLGGVSTIAGGVPGKVISADTSGASATTSSNFPGPASHAPTECSEMGEHYDRPLTDSTISAPLGKVYSLMFGPASGAFMRRWLVDDQKSRDLNYTDDKIGLDNEHKSFTFDYVKPLSAPVGPRQTKCITTNTLLAYDLEKAVTIDCSTITPDVPSGGSFTTRTRYCLMWGPGDSTRIIATCTIEWSAKSWLKGAIEKGANDGQIEYVKSILAALRVAAVSKAPVKGVGKKGKRRERRENAGANEGGDQMPQNRTSEVARSNWGLFEPVHKIVQPVIDLVNPFLTSQVIIAVMFALLAYTWILPPGTARDVNLGGHASHERIAAYQEIWRQEESELWDWLDDRTGMSGILRPPRDTKSFTKTKPVKSGSLSKKLDEERLSTRQMNDAIRMTEERLVALKEAMKRRQAS